MKKRILQLAWPVMVSSLLNTTFITIDLFWLGKLGEIEIAAVSIAGAIMGIIYPLAMTVSSGTLALIARFKGNDDPIGIENTIINSLLLSFVLSLFLFLSLFPFATQIVSLFKPEHSLIIYSSQYLRIMFIGLFFLIPYINTNAIYYAIGDTKTAMFIGIFVNITNIILDPILIFGLLGFDRMGIRGAAIASILSNLLGLIISVVILINRKVISLSLIKRTRITFRWIRRILNIGVPSSLQGITRPLTGTLLYRIISLYGTGAIAGFGIGVNILGWMFIYLNGFASASSILVGQHIGRGQHRKAESTIWHSANLGVGIQLLFSFLFFVFAPFIIKIFRM
ncbi:MAG: MATE family efflux transporter [Proteobacteria bacterium]|nr:MATE family efflux transporter [Pseudomonadota bacterium]